MMTSEREPGAAPRKEASQKDMLRDSLNMVAIVLLCAIFTWLRWKKLDELLFGDPVHWLHEVSRVARGEIPYRDFSFQYPPFTAFFFGWGFRWFGITFTTAQILVDFWSVAVVLLSYILARFLLPRALHLPVCFLVMTVGVTSLTNFNLFSFRTYSPSLQTGAAGALLSIWGMLRYLRYGKLRGINRWMIVVGSALALLSKPEYALAQCCALMLLAAVSRRRFPGPTPGNWARDHLQLTLACVLPAAAIYAWIAFEASPAKMLAGISGYGLATFSCPWWPTGLGVFGVLAAIGEAIVVAVLLSLPWRECFATVFGRAYHRLRLLAIPGAIVSFAYIVYENKGAVTSGHSAMEKAKLILPSLLWSTPVFLPVMWTAIILFFYLIARLFGTHTRPEVRNSIGELLVVLVFPVAMCPRALFGTTQSVFPEVTAVCYPFLMVLGPYFLWKFLSSAWDCADRITPATVIVIAMVVAYGVIRLIGGASLLNDKHYQTLHTEAGTVKVGDYFPAADIYKYVVSHTSKSDYVLELPYGGGVNFATGRANPIFDTQLFGMAMPAIYQQLDLQRIQEHPPKLIIAEDSPRFGTYYGYGLKGNRACVCPRLVWIPDRPSWDPNVVYPVVDYIARHYRPDFKIGGKVILAPRHDSDAGVHD